MKYEERTPDVLDFAYQIVAMHQDLMALKAENEQLREYRQKYADLLNDSIAHGQKMVVTVLDGLLDKAQREAAQ